PHHVCPRTLDSGFGTPLGGRQAFGGVSNGYRSSRLDLSSLSGQNFRVRFRVGSDNVVGDVGWDVDDVRIYTCAVPTPGLSITKAADQSSVAAGQVIDYTVTVSNTGNVDLTNGGVTDPSGPGW